MESNGQHLHAFTVICCLYKAIDLDPECQSHLWRSRSFAALAFGDPWGQNLEQMDWAWFSSTPTVTIVTILGLSSDFIPSLHDPYVPLESDASCKKRGRSSCCLQHTAKGKGKLKKKKKKKNFNWTCRSFFVQFFNAKYSCEPNVLVKQRLLQVSSTLLESSEDQPQVG